MADEKTEFPILDGRGSATYRAYSVEARYNNTHPKEIAGRLLDNRWKKIDFARGPVGVPSGEGFMEPMNGRLGLLSYQAAQALRWWFHAEAEKSGPLGCLGGLCVETRLIRHDVKFEYTSSAVDAIEVVDESYRRKSGC